MLTWQHEPASRHDVEAGAPSSALASPPPQPWRRSVPASRRRERNELGGPVDAGAVVDRVATVGVARQLPRLRAGGDGVGAADARAGKGWSDRVEPEAIRVLVAIDDS